MNSRFIDISVGAFLCLFSVVVFWYADRYSGRGVNAYGPDFFPKALSALMFLCASLLILKAIIKPSFVTTETINPTGFVRATGALVLAIAYLLTMKLVGFYVATVLFLFLLMMLVGQKGHMTRLVVSLVIASLIFGIFHFFLKIPLPEGLIYTAVKGI